MGILPCKDSSKFELEQNKMSANGTTTALPDRASAFRSQSAKYANGTDSTPMSAKKPTSAASTQSSFAVKAGLAQMLKGGVIMDVVRKSISSHFGAGLETLRERPRDAAIQSLLGDRETESFFEICLVPR